MQFFDITIERKLFITVLFLEKRKSIMFICAYIACIVDSNNLLGVLWKIAKYE